MVQPGVPLRTQVVKPGSGSVFGASRGAAPPWPDRAVAGLAADAQVDALAVRYGGAIRSRGLRARARSAAEQGGRDEQLLHARSSSAAA